MTLPALAWLAALREDDLEAWEYAIDLVLSDMSEPDIIEELWGEDPELEEVWESE